MDGNKDEADRCIQIALRCIQSGEREKARKFLIKAERLYPSEKVKELLARVSGSSSNTNGSAAGPEEPSERAEADDGSGADGPRQRRGRGHAAANEASPTAAGAASGESVHTEAKYTPDQLGLVRKIVKCKDYYEILGVSKDGTEDDLKKAYRKLALKLHPDKNHAPGATEAFKAVGKAFGVLNDTEKRKRYDMYGSEAERATSSRRNAHSHNGHYEFDDDISAEEIFNMFFGGAFPTTNVRTRRMYTQREHHFTQNNNQADNTYGFLLQLSPILFMIFLSLLSSLLVADATFSMSRDQKFSVERYTQNLRIPYYVKPDFATEYKGSMRRLEQQVEEEFISTLRSNCFKERSYKENMLWRARNFGDGKLYEKAQNLKTPSCDRLQSIYA